MSAFHRSLPALVALTLLSTSCAMPAAEHAWIPPRWKNARAVSPEDRAAVAAVASFLARRSTGLSPSEVARTARVIVFESRRAGLAAGFVLAVIEVESGGDRFAASSAGALGLMQLLPTTAEAVAARIGVPWCGPETLFDPVANVRLGVSYLAQLQRRFGTLSATLAAYNWGPSHIARRRRAGRALPVAYPRRVMAAYGRLSSRA